MYNIKVINKETGDVMMQISGVVDPKRALKAYSFEDVEIVTDVAKIEPKKLSLWARVKLFFKRLLRLK